MASPGWPMRESRGGTSAERIRDLEAVLGTALPEDYVGFLRIHNGGTPARDRVSFRDQDGCHQDTTLSRFFGVDDVEDDLARTWEYFLEQERVPPGYLPIASDGFGNMLVLSLSGDGAGSVWFWDHEREHLEGEKMLCAVARSFGELMHGLG
jgi:cell wall assembly regulator SMI1